MTIADSAALAARTETRAPESTPRWSSRAAFLAAAVGSAVGLGSIWKFPYIVGANGGGAFVLVYLAFVAAVGVPIMVVELALGRRGGPSVVRTLSGVAGRAQPYGWNALGWLGAIAAFVILSFYSVVAGWSLAYAVRGMLGGFSGLSPETSGAMFAALLADPAEMIAWHSLLLAAVAWIVARGVKGGIEAASNRLMPLLALLMLGLAVYACVIGDFGRGVDFLFRPDFGALTTAGVLSAAGHAFFTLSLGMGAMIAYGGYLGEDVSAPKMAVWVAASDTVCSLAAGLAIFPIVFAFGLDPAEGPGLVFVALPTAFAVMPGGAVFGTLFFVLLLIAALVSAVSALEPMVAATSSNDGSRRRQTARLAIAAWALGLVSVFSFNVWKDVSLTGSSKTIFDWLNYLTAELALPLGGVGLAVFAGWFAPKHWAREAFGSELGYRAWLFLVRFVAPAVVAVVLLDLML
jgi:NSS family neurotransmitter:Na+ symporter